MASEKDLDLSTKKSQLSQAPGIWNDDIVGTESHVNVLQEKLMEIEATLQVSEENTNKELKILWQRVKTTETLLTYLKSKAIIIAIPLLAHTSCGIKPLDGLGFVDKNALSVSKWTGINNLLFPSDSSDDEKWGGISHQKFSPEGQDGAYISEMLKSVQFVTDVMKNLVKRVTLAESETALEKEKFAIREEEMREKELKIETMSMKVQEMEKFKDDTNGILLEMRQKVEDLVEETIRQRQRETENEEELCRVKEHFESLKSYVASLISVREALMTSEKQFKKMEELFERFTAKTEKLESEKAQKEGEVQKLMKENARLTDLLDKKEAQLLAMTEQCKYMALSGSRI